MARGKLIVFEGLDRAGKSTQCAMLAQALQEAGRSVRLMRFPGEFFRGVDVKGGNLLEWDALFQENGSSDIYRGRPHDADWADDQ